MLNHKHILCGFITLSLAFLPFLSASLALVKISIRPHIKMFSYLGELCVTKSVSSSGDRKLVIF